MMHKLFAASCLVGVVITGAIAAPAYAGGGNPSGTGPPSQSCEDSVAAGGTTPGRTASSPGAPFNEGVGTGGLNYSEKSQYDVACVKGPQAPPPALTATSATDTSVTDSLAPATTGPHTNKHGHTPSGG
jgi:hypothetical protein